MKQIRWFPVAVVLAAAVGLGYVLLKDRGRPPAAEGIVIVDKTPPGDAKMNPVNGTHPVEPPAPNGDGHKEQKAEPPPPAQPPADPVSEIQKLIETERWLEAREALVRAYFAPKTTPAQRDQMEAQMLRVAQVLYFEKPLETEFVMHTVETGESLSSIAARYRKKGMKLEFGMIKLMNGMKRDLVRLGSQLKIPKGTFSIVVRKSTFKLLVFYNGIAFRQYRVGIGKDHKTPTAKFSVGAKTAQPVWWPPESTGLTGPIPADDPRNPLGSHWIALESTQYPGLGIHGTREPDSIGKDVSQGCVRMLNEEVKEIFELATPGMEVSILD